MAFRMKDFILKRKAWFGYPLFVLILTGALLYYLFPADAVRDYFQARGRRANPPLALSVDHVTPSVPIGVKFTRTKVALEDMPSRVILDADRLLIKPKLLSLLLGKSQFSFLCEAYQGDVRGSVHLKQEPEVGFDTKIALRNIRIGDYSYLSHLLGRPLKGTLGGTISYSGQYKPMVDGSGEANLTLSDGSFELLQPFLTLKSIDFSEMEVEMALAKERLNLTRLELKGKQLQGTLSGTITLREEFAQSSLDLKGTIEPFAALFKSNAGMQNTVAIFKQRLTEGTLSFVIRGTVKEPKIEFT